MLNYQDCHIELISYKLYGFHKFGGFVRVHSCGRLVKKQKLRVGRKGSRYFKLTLFSVRKIAGKIVSFLFKVENAEKLFCTVSHCGLGLEMFR